MRWSCWWVWCRKHWYAGQMSETWHSQNLSLGLCTRAGKRGVLGCRERELLKNENIPGDVIVKFHCLVSMAIGKAYFSQSYLVPRLLIPILDSIVLFFFFFFTSARTVTVWREKKALLQLHRCSCARCGGAALSWYWWDLDNPECRGRPWGEGTCIPVLALLLACSVILDRSLNFFLLLFPLLVLVQELLF